jgi:hypothetical protein
VEVCPVDLGEGAGAHQVTDLEALGAHDPLGHIDQRHVCSEFVCGKRGEKPATRHDTRHATRDTRHDTHDERGEWEKGGGETGWGTDVEEGAVARHVLSALRHSELDLLQAERRGGMPVGLDTVGAEDVDRLDLVLEPALDQAVDILHQEAEEPANQTNYQSLVMVSNQPASHS